MTDLTKLAEQLDAFNELSASLAISEAARILRAAAGVDVAGLMALALTMPPRSAREERDRHIAALESSLRLVLAQRVPPGCVVVPVERLTVEEIKTLRQQVRNDPRCQDEHWFVLMARAIEDRYLAAALTDQSQKKESP